MKISDLIDNKTITDVSMAELINLSGIEGSEDSSSKINLFDLFDVYSGAIYISSSIPTVLFMNTLNNGCFPGVTIGHQEDDGSCTSQSKDDLIGWNNLCFTSLGYIVNYINSYSVETNTDSRYSYQTTLTPESTDNILFIANPYIYPAVSTPLGSDYRGGSYYNYYNNSYNYSWSLGEYGTNFFFKEDNFLYKNGYGDLYSYYISSDDLVPCNMPHAGIRVTAFQLTGDNFNAPPFYKVMSITPDIHLYPGMILIPKKTNGLFTHKYYGEVLKEFNVAVNDTLDEYSKICPGFSYKFSQKSLDLGFSKSYFTYINDNISGIIENAHSNTDDLIYAPSLYSPIIKFNTEDQ